MKNIKYVLIFIIVLFFNLVCSPVNVDEIWNYGFSVNLYHGLVPYLDFNMVLTPFYPFFMSLFFYLFGSSMLVFHVVNAIVVTFCFILLNRMYHEKSFLFFLFFFFPVNFSFPNYNFFLFVLLVIVIYIEENFVSKYFWSHYLVGFLLGLLILTKQTVGFCLLFPSLYYIKEKKVLRQRFFGFLIPVLIFIIYLLLTGSFYSFINLCVLGLFEFSGNHKLDFILAIATILMFVGTIYFIKKDKHDIVGYYALCFYSLVIPIVDVYHFFISFLAFLLVVCKNIKKQYVYYAPFSIICVLFLAFLNAYNNNFSFSNYPNDINHFEYRYINPSNYKFTKRVLNYMNKNKDKEIIFINSDAYYFKLILEMDISYLDLINLGNLGYRGSDYLLDTIKKSKGSLFLVNPHEYGGCRQTDQVVIKYILTEGKKIKSLGLYDVYILD